MKRLKLFANCRVVDGPVNSIIVDIQREEFYQIDRQTSWAVKALTGKLPDNESTKHFFSEEELEELAEKLCELDMAFWCSKDLEGNFPELNLYFDSYESINNSIIEMSEFVTLTSLKKIIPQLELLKCKHLEIRMYDDNSDELEDVFKLIKFSDIRSISLKVNVYRFPDLKRLVALTKKYLKVSLIELFSVTDVESKVESEFAVFYKHLSKLEGSHQCGVVASDYFTINIESFTEAINHNSCLNKKISVDRFGEIKNCPSMRDSFGNIQDTTLSAVLENEKFKRIFNIKKDDVEICMDCEFRYVCTDCRAYVEDSKNLYSKPLKCGYDPYTGEWSEWSDSLLKRTIMTAYRQGTL